MPSSSMISAVVSAGGLPMVPTGMFSRPKVPSMKRAAVGMAILFGFMLVNAAYWDRIGNRNLTLVVLYALLMLSLVPLTGWSGQICSCPSTHPCIE